MPSNARDPLRTPGFPVQQLFILAICRVCEPISFTSIFPYIYQMIETFDIAENENGVAVYAGMVTSAFAFAEFSTGMMWGRISDKIGRKPVVIVGLAGTLISTLMFGFAKSLPIALLARALGGGLNGNIGVIQTTVAELVTEKEHQPSAFAIMPFVWCLGSIVGPALGGLLVEPTRFYPHIFPPGGLLEEYPFLLPNVVASIVLAIGIANGILFLDETHEVLRHKRDIGRECGDKLLILVGLKKRPVIKQEGYSWPASEESERLLSGRHTTHNTFANGEEDAKLVSKKPPSLSQAFTRPVVGLVISYGILAYHTMGFEQLMPVFLSTPPGEKPRHPFFFSGGLGLTTHTIGFILSIQGLFSMCTQFLVFPPVARRFGVLNVYRFCMFTYPICYILVPYLDWLPERFQMVGIYCILAVKIIHSVLSYPCNTILLTNTAPSLLILGAINGVAASCASLARSFSPTLTGMVYSKGLDINMVGLAWWVNGLVCVLGGAQALLMKHSDFENSPTEDTDQNGCQSAQDIAVGTEAAYVDMPTKRVEETLDEYGLVRSVVSGEIVSLSGSVPRYGSLSGSVPRYGVFC